MKFIDYLMFYSMVVLMAMCVIYPAISQIETSKKTNFYPIWENTTKVIPVYKEIIPNTPYDCIDNKTDEAKICINTTIEKTFDKMMTITTSSKIIGYTDGNIEIKGFVNEEKGVIVKFDFDPKGRDYKVFGRCRQYEIDKGVCHEY